MRYTFVFILAAVVLSGCHKKSKAIRSIKQTDPLVAWGASKDEALAKLDKIKAKIISNTGDVIVAEFGPAGLTSSDGKPVTHPLRVEYDFKDGKLAQMKTTP